MTSNANRRVIRPQVFGVAPPATKLTITTQPSSGPTSGVPFPQQPVIQVRDVSNNPVNQTGWVVSASRNGGSDTLGGTLTAITNSSGVATFTDLKFTGTSGPNTILFSATALTGVTSGSVTPTSGASPDSLYFASNEAPLTNAVLTADFRNGIWYRKTVDQNSANGTPWASGGVDGLGWGGNDQGLVGGPGGIGPTPADATINLQAIGKKPLFTQSNYAATTGIIDGSVGMTQRNNAWHNLQGAESGGYMEVWVRWHCFYVPANYFGAGNPAVDYAFSGQKHITGNRYGDDSGIWWFGVGYNVGAGGQSSNGELMATSNHGDDVIYHQNVSLMNHVAGNWYYNEANIRLNTPGNADGVFRLYINNGGPNGDFSGQTPILRAFHTGLNFGYGSTGGTNAIGSIWPENWSSNDQLPLGTKGSSGQQFWENIVVVQGARGGPIGFVP